jgi:hypothetical protein
MEFTYTLTEDDYLKAATIRLPRSARGPWARTLSTTYLVYFFLSVGLIVATGRILEWFDLTGGKLGNLPIGDVLGSSIVPMLILPALVLILFKAVTYFPARKARIEQFYKCIGCTVATTAVVSAQYIAFRSEAGTSECSWKCFGGWNSQGGLLVLAGHTNTRHILRIAELEPAQISELMQILASALPHR